MFSPADHFVGMKLNSELGERVYASDLFDSASHRTIWKVLWQRVQGKDNRLLNLSATGAAGHAGHRTYIGRRQVPLCLIRGTENRAADFDASFNPLRRHDRERWMGVLLAMRKGVTMPPVELIQVGDVFYVRDGHHRISAARQMGQAEIEAEVTLWQPD